MNLPDGWQQVTQAEDPDIGDATVAAWRGSHAQDERDYATVVLYETGVVSAVGGTQSAHSFPVELLPYIESAWVNWQKGKGI